MMKIMANFLRDDMKSFIIDANASIDNEKIMPKFS